MDRKEALKKIGENMALREKLEDECVELAAKFGIQFTSFAGPVGNTYMSEEAEEIHSRRREEWDAIEDNEDLDGEAVERAYEELSAKWEAEDGEPYDVDDWPYDYYGAGWAHSDIC